MYKSYHAITCLICCCYFYLCYYNIIIFYCKLNKYIIISYHTITLFVAHHLIMLQWQAVICCALLQLLRLLLSALYIIQYICVCYRKLLYYITYHNTSYLFNHSMCCISYHNVTLCDLHPHPYYTIHHHQHSHQLTLKL